jgi:hypothetical protein
MPVKVWNSTPKGRSNFHIDLYRISMINLSQIMVAHSELFNLGTTLLGQSRQLYSQSLNNERKMTLANVNNTERNI